MIWWTKPTESGLGDRLVDILHMVAYARVMGAPLCLEWPTFQIKDIDTTHRAKDIQLANVLAHIRFPGDVFFQRPEGNCQRFDYTLGGDPDPDSFYSKYLSGMYSIEYYRKVFDRAARQFEFCDEIERFLAGLPPKFVAFHIRRGDKVRDEPGDGTFIHRDELANLNELTYRAIDHLMGFDAFFFCGDEDAKVAPFAEYVRSRGRSVIELPAMEKWRTTYFDLAAMSRSRTVVTSNRYSAFSRFAAIIGGASISTVYQL